MLTSCVHPDGRFRVGVHQPSYTVRNLRARRYREVLGQLPDGREIENNANFPEGDIAVRSGNPVYEIANALPFRGCTFIDAGWARPRALNPASIAIQTPAPLSLRKHLAAQGIQGLDGVALRTCIASLPLQLRYALAATSSDAEELIWLAETCCSFIYADNGKYRYPKGLLYEEHQGRVRPVISDSELFETIANNPHLPDRYKEVMVLRPGAQGTSPITADMYYDDCDAEKGGAIFEYLRANSYIPGGHYAANFAHTSRRYSIAELSLADMRGLRHLYYQRICTVLAAQFGLELPEQGRALSEDGLETLRLAVLDKVLASGGVYPHPATLWGWNFGYDFSPTGYRLHASHQMIHQQYALVPEIVQSNTGETLPAFSCGDLVADAARAYQAAFHSDFFADYLNCITANTRVDGRDGASSLAVWQDENVLLFVPKAQVSQWELNLMVIANSESGPVGNVVEANTSVRASIDQAMHIAQQILAKLGAAMVTSIEYSKRLGLQNGQRLIYAFLPKLPWAMGGFTEAQGRYVLGHYPEDFAAACRLKLQKHVQEMGV
ncbi:MAG: hypothetical protein GX087_12005 [Desulfobulbaceae bacterium]|nr:hypothetical protein [Desulfobulbaceae bacterium]